MAAMAGLIVAAAGVAGQQGGRISSVNRSDTGITHVPGIKVGHFTRTERPTGCTVILAEYGAVGGVDGGVPEDAYGESALGRTPSVLSGLLHVGSPSGRGFPTNPWPS